MQVYISRRDKCGNDAFKPIELLELLESEEVRIKVLPEEFPDLVDKVNAEALGDMDKALREARERWMKW
ncbi:MAG: hypothetical protein GSR82_01295 [Desulfurococcales archaeon]|nr:hypothetical protein [Desulfurococcales archaeon]